MPHELFTTTRQTIKIRNVFINNVSTDIKLSKIQISKIIQSARSFGSELPKLGKNALTNIPGLVSNWTSNAISIFERKINGKWTVLAGKGYTFKWIYEQYH